MRNVVSPISTSGGDRPCGPSYSSVDCSISLIAAYFLCCAQRFEFAFLSLNRRQNAMVCA